MAYNSSFKARTAGGGHGYMMSHDGRMFRPVSVKKIAGSQ